MPNSTLAAWATGLADKQQITTVIG